MLIMLSGGVFPSSNLQAAVIVQQNPFSSFEAPVLSISDSVINFQSVLDNFSISQAIEVSKITFWSFELEQSGILSNAVTLNIFDAVSEFDHNSPAYAATSATTETPFSRSVENPNVNLIRHEVDISGLTLDAGDYFLNIGADYFNNSNAPFGWANAESSSILGVAENALDFADSKGVLTNPQVSGVDLAFMIEGTVVQDQTPTVSAPGSLLFSFGVLTLIAITRKYRQK